MDKTYPLFTFRLSDEELKKIKQAAEIENLRPSAYARKAVLDGVERTFQNKEAVR